MFFSDPKFLLAIMSLCVQKVRMRYFRITRKQKMVSERGLAKKREEQKDFLSVLSIIWAETPKSVRPVSAVTELGKVQVTRVAVQRGRGTPAWLKQELSSIIMKWRLKRNAF